MRHIWKIKVSNIKPIVYLNPRFLHFMSTYFTATGWRKQTSHVFSAIWPRASKRGQLPFLSLCKRKQVGSHIWTRHERLTHALCERRLSLLIVPVLDNIYRLVHIRQTLFKCLKRAQIKMDAISRLFLVTICRTAIGPPIRTNLSQKIIQCRASAFPGKCYLASITFWFKAKEIIHNFIIVWMVFCSFSSYTFI